MSLSKILVNNQDTGFEGIPLQDTGQSTERVMSQKAVTDTFIQKTKIKQSFGDNQDNIISQAFLTDMLSLGYEENDVNEKYGPNVERLEDGVFKVVYTAKQQLKYIGPFTFPEDANYAIYTYKIRSITEGGRFDFGFGSGIPYRWLFNTGYWTVNRDSDGYFRVGLVKNDVRASSFCLWFGNVDNLYPEPDGHEEIVIIENVHLYFSPDTKLPSTLKEKVAGLTVDSETIESQIKILQNNKSLFSDDIFNVLGKKLVLNENFLSDFLVNGRIRLVHEYSGESWAYCKFTPDRTKKITVNIKRDISSPGFIARQDVIVFIASGRSVNATFWQSVKSSSKETFSVEIDIPAFAELYPDITDYYVWVSPSRLAAPGEGLESILDCVITETENFENISGITVCDTFKSIDQLFSETNEITDADVLSTFGQEKICAVTNNFYLYDSDIDKIKIQHQKTAETWAYCQRFVPDFSLPVIVEFTVEESQAISEHGVKTVVWVSPTGTYQSSVSQIVFTISSAGTYKLSFDPQYYVAHVSELYSTFSIWFNPGRQNYTDDFPYTYIKNVKIYQIDSLENLEGINNKEITRSIDANISYVKQSISELSSSNILVSPSGEKFMIGVTNNGQIVSIPMIPSKIAMFGNSLIGGSGYGMAASDSEHDYYYLITEFIKTLKPNLISTKNPGAVSTFETGTDRQTVLTTGVSNIVNGLQGDETMVAIQLSDNTPSAQESFIEDAYIELFTQLRIKCPNARIVYHGAWYDGSWKKNAISSACQKTGALYISYDGLSSPESRNVIGGVQKQNSQWRQYTNVISVSPTGESEGSYNYIYVTFTVNSTTYNTTLPVLEYTFENNVLRTNGEYSFITSGGVASHPNNEGFRRIANRFLYLTGISDTEETYPAE